MESIQNRFNPIITKVKNQTFQPELGMTMQEYVAKMDEAFARDTDFYKEFKQQNMKQLESELFPVQGVHEAELRTGLTYKVYRENLQQLREMHQQIATN